MSRRRIRESSGLKTAWLLTTGLSGLLGLAYLLSRGGPHFLLEIIFFGAWFSSSSLWLLFHAGMSEEGQPIPSQLGPANSLTFLRLSLSPLLLSGLAGNREFWIPSVALIVFLSLTDLLDGQIARRLNMETRLGRTMDPIADLVLLFCMAIALYTVDLMPLWLLWGFVLRYPVVFATGLFFALYGRPFAIKATKLGKLCNATISTALTLSYIAAATNPSEDFLQWVSIIVWTTSVPLVVNVVFLFAMALKALKMQLDIGWQKASNALDQDDSKRLFQGGHMNDFKSLDDILDYAMQKEQEAVDLYSKLSKDARNEAIKKTFLEFADEERGHKAKLQGVKDGKKMIGSALKVQDLKIAQYTDDSALGDNPTYQDVLIFAMKQEKAAFKLYSDLAAGAPDATTKELFSALAQEEAKHKLRFEMEYDDNVLTEN